MGLCGQSFVMALAGGGRLARLFCRLLPGWPRYSLIRGAVLRASGASVQRGENSSAGLGCVVAGNSAHHEQATALSGDEWHTALGIDHARQRVIDDLRCGRIPEWGKEIHRLTGPGESVLELGSGTGQISLSLAKSGRRVTLLDVFQGSLDFAADCARESGVEASTVCADATQPLPFAENTFDCVWSGGLLEHFSRAEVVGMLADSARVSKGIVVSLVPNANCLAYRLGKRLQEANGTWPFGLEEPRWSMAPEFEEAGFHSIEERSVGALHALSFLPECSPAMGAIKAWLDSMSEEQMALAGQGYLLLTVGMK